MYRSVGLGLVKAQRNLDLLKAFHFCRAISILFYEKNRHIKVTAYDLKAVWLTKAKLAHK